MIDHGRLAALKGEIAVVAVGQTDYVADFARPKAEPRTDALGLAADAFGQALKDGGLRREDIDGIVVGLPLAVERVGECLGIDVTWSAQADAVNAVITGALAIQAGFAQCIALVYGNDQRSVRTAYGGPNAMGGDRYLAYVYYTPWGLTSQGALYAMTANRFMFETGFSDVDLAQVAVSQRAFAALNPAAILRTPLSVEGYLASRFICEPLRLPDYCLINDGGVALILTTTDRARRMGRPYAVITGMGRSDMMRNATSLEPRIASFYHPAHAEAAEAVYRMAGVGPADIDVLQIYDSFSIHVPLALEGFGFCAIGESAKLFREVGIGPGGGLPVNTSGGQLAESYMQGWSQQVEIVRQLRGEAGTRQVIHARNAQYISDVAGKVASLIYQKSEQ